MQLIIKFNKRIRFLLCVIDNFSKYTWIIPLKDEIGFTITNAFQKILDKSNCKPKKIWVAKGIEFYDKPKKSWLKKKWNRIIFSAQWMKICCCCKIHYKFEKYKL